MIDDRSTANKLESAVFQTRMLIMLDMTQSQMLKNLVAMKVDFQSGCKALKKAPLILKMRRGRVGWAYMPPLRQTGQYVINIWFMFYRFI